MVPKRPGSDKAVPYFHRSDAYALSGFGSFQPLENALLSELGSPATARWSEAMTKKSKRMLSPRPVDWAIALAVIAAAVVASLLVSQHLFAEAKQKRIEQADSDEIIVDSIYDDRVEGAHDPDYDPSRYQAIAKSLAKDPIYFDGYPGLDIDDDDIDALRTELSDANSPIYVAFLTVDDLDDADGDLDLLAARIVTEVEEPDAAVLTISSGGVTGLGEKGMTRPSLHVFSRDHDDSGSTTVLKAVREIESAEAVDVEDEFSPHHDDDGNPRVTRSESEDDPRDLSYSLGAAVGGIALGLFVGGGLGVGIAFGLRAMRARNAATSGTAKR
jgi:hypothetical protein